MVTMAEMKHAAMLMKIFTDKLKFVTTNINNIKIYVVLDFDDEYASSISYIYDNRYILTHNPEIYLYNPTINAKSKKKRFEQISTYCCYLTLHELFHVTKESDYYMYEHDSEYHDFVEYQVDANAIRFIDNYGEWISKRTGYPIIPDFFKGFRTGKNTMIAFEKASFIHGHVVWNLNELNGCSFKCKLDCKSCVFKRV